MPRPPTVREQRESFLDQEMLFLHISTWHYLPLRSRVKEVPIRGLKVANVEPPRFCTLIVIAITEKDPEQLNLKRKKYLILALTLRSTWDRINPASLEEPEAFSAHEECLMHILKFSR